MIHFYQVKNIQNQFNVINEKYMNDNDKMSINNCRKAVDEITEYAKTLKESKRIKTYDVDETSRLSVTIELWSGIILIYSPQIPGLF